MTAIRVSCPECDTVLRVTADPPPRRIACPKCGTDVPVRSGRSAESTGVQSSPSRSRPLASRRRDEEDDDAPRRSDRRSRGTGSGSKPQTGLIIAGALVGGGLLIIAAGGGVVLWMLASKPQVGGHPAVAAAPGAPVAGPNFPAAPAAFVPPPNQVPVGAAVPPPPAVAAAQAAAPPAIGDLAFDRMQTLKDATVFIKVETNTVAGSGSGFLVDVQGTRAIVATNQHVITPPTVSRTRPGFPPAPRGPFGPRPGLAAGQTIITCVFRSGTPEEHATQATVLTSDKDVDLALLQVNNVPNLPPPIGCSQRLQLVETMKVWIFGFPFGEKLEMKRGNPVITVGLGTVSSLRRNDAGELAAVQIDGNLNPGNSGGPIVDGLGRLVGVSVAKVVDSNIGMAVPREELVKMLQRQLRR